MIVIATSAFLSQVAIATLGQTLAGCARDDRPDVAGLNCPDSVMTDGRGLNGGERVWERLNLYRDAPCDDLDSACKFIGETCTEPAPSLCSGW
jgi:hypothetical protein